MGRIIFLLGRVCPQSVRNAVKDRLILPTWPLWGGERIHPPQQLPMLGIYRHHITYQNASKNSSSGPYIPRSLAFSCNEVPSILPSVVQNTNYLGPSRPPFAQEWLPSPLMMVYQGKSYPNCIHCVRSCRSEAYRPKSTHTRQRLRSIPSRIICPVFYALKASLSLFTCIILPN